MIMNAMKKVFWWIMDAIAYVLYGIRGIWRISRKPYRLVEKKYMVVKILTTIAKLVIVVYIAMTAVALIAGIVIGIILINSFFRSAESAMRNNF